MLLDLLKLGMGTGSVASFVTSLVLGRLILGRSIGSSMKCAV